MRRHSVLVNGAFRVFYVSMLRSGYRPGRGMNITHRSCVSLTLGFVSLGERFGFLICVAGRSNEFRGIDSQQLSGSGLITSSTCLPQHVLQRRITRYIKAPSAATCIQGYIKRTFCTLRILSILRSTHEPLHLGLHLLHRILPPGCPLAGRSERESISCRKFKEVVLLLRTE